MEAYVYLSKVYNELMSDVDYLKWAQYLDGLLRQYGVKTIFETACGTGAMTRALYDMGYDITASDVSPEMIRIALESARSGGRDIKFALQDMRSIEVGNKVDAIVSVCDGPNYLDAPGFKKFAASAYSALKENGVALFDISSKYKLKRMDGEVFFDDGDDASCIWQNTYDNKGSSLDMDVTLFVRRGNLFERFTEQHTQYAHDAGFVKEAFISAEFADVLAFECFTQNPPGEETERIQFVAQKAMA